METKYVQSNVKNRNWKARWIWAQDSGNIENSYYYFRKEFSLNEIKSDIKLLITAETRYQLFLNGNFIGEGPPQSQPYLKYYNIHKLNSYLKSGKNCIGIIVNFTGTMPDTRGGLLLEILDNNENVILKSDESWRARRTRAWRQNTFQTPMNKVTTHQEFFDARQVPEGWNQVGFIDNEWQKVTVIKGRYSNRPPAVPPWSNLIPRDIPFMEKYPVLPENIEKIEECLDINNRNRSEDLSIVLSTPGKEKVKYAKIKKEDNLLKDSGQTIIQNSTNHLDGIFDGIYDPCVILDFGRVITGYIELELNGVAGGIVDIGYAERLIDGEFNNAIEGQFADRYTMKDGQQCFRSFTWKGYRYVKLRFNSCFEKVKIKSIKTIITTYPFQEQGKLETEDQEIQNIFDISKYTLRLCSNEFIMDTPWREQGQWLGDVSAVTLGGIYSCFGDTKLPAKFLKQSGANQHPTGMLDNVTNIVSKSWQNSIPDYSLWWVMAIWDHYQYTGKEEWIHQYYPHVMKVIHAFMGHIDENGLISDMPYWTLIDWAHLDRRGEMASLNAIFYGCLEKVQKMAEFKNDEYTREQIKEVRKGIRSNFTERFFDSKKGCLVDANIDGELSDMVSEHSNASAILWGLCDKEIVDEIVSNFYEKENISYTEAQPYYTTVVLQALDSIERFDLALKIIRDRWGKRMVDRGASSVFEEWYINGSWRSGEFKGFLRTQSHAWSAHPAEFLIKNLIGLEILQPGCKQIKVNPKDVDFDYNVVYPTPLGEIKVIKEGNQIKINSADKITIIEK